MVEYLYQEGVEPCSKEPLKIRLDGVHVGEIRRVKGGYQYFAKGGGSKGGEILPGVDAVQKFLGTDTCQGDCEGTNSNAGEASCGDGGGGEGS